MHPQRRQKIIGTILSLFCKIKLTGIENIPSSGPLIMASNHMSIFDAPLGLSSYPFSPLNAFIGERWERYPIIAPLFRALGGIYINRHEMDRQALKQGLDALKSGAYFALAPEGTRSKIHQLLPAKTGVAYIADKANAPIIPIAMINTDLVVDNLKRLKRTPIEIRYGKPFYLPPLEKRARKDDLERYTTYIMIQIADLLPPSYHGHYANHPALEILRTEDTTAAWNYLLSHDPT